MGVWGVARRTGDTRHGVIASELSKLCRELELSGAALWILDGQGNRVLEASEGDPVRGGRPFERDDPVRYPTAELPLTVDGRPVGVIVVPAHVPLPPPGDVDPLLEWSARVIERALLLDAERRYRLGAEHARRHLTLLAEAGAVLGAPYDDPETALAAVVDVMVPAFADWCAVDVPDGASVLRLAWASAEPADRARIGDLHAGHQGWSHPVLRTIASGQSELMAALGRATDHPAEDGDHVALAVALGLDSCLLVPIRLRGLNVGVITCGTTLPRRGFRPSDVKAVEEVASRVAAAVERALLYRESQNRAEQAGRQAAQLRRLMEAALAIHARHTLGEVLGVVAEQARRVMQAQACIAGLTEERRPEPPGGAAVDRSVGLHAISWDEDPHPDLDEPALVARLFSADSPPSAVQHFVGTGSEASATADGAVSGALTDTAGRTIGALMVVGRESGQPFLDDEPLLVSLAQMASVALESASLYERASASEARLRALVDASPMAIVELGPEGDVRQANAAARTMFGWQDHHGVWRLPVMERDGAPFDTLALLGAGAPAQLEVVRRTPAGAVDLSIATAPLRWSIAAPEGTLVVVADVTERKRLEEQTAKARRMEAVGRTAGGVAHDLNNLLTVVLGHSHLLLRVMDTGDSARDSVEAIRMAGERAANLSSQLLTISRGHLVEPEIVDVSATIESMETVLRRLVPEEIELDVIAGREVGPVLVGRGQLEQVLLNLVVNARDAIPERETAGGRITVAASQQGDTATVVITDTGEGMETEVLEHCFEPFVTTKSRPGSGLGLATVYGIVTQGGGTVSVTSERGTGTTFTLRLPRASGRPDDTPGPRSDDQAGGQERVLLVEDDPAVRSLAHKILAQEGYRVTEASSGRDALAIVGRSVAGFDVVITDVAMPDMDGVELVAWLSDAYGACPTLYVSGYVDDAVGDPETLPRGADFLAKPFSPAALLTKVREVLDRPVTVGGSNPPRAQS